MMVSVSVIFSKAVRIENTTVYYQDTDCCENHGGPSCLRKNSFVTLLTFLFYLAICNPVCGSNEVCSAPNNCTCIEGWVGEHCQQGKSTSPLHVMIFVLLVDQLEESNITSSSVTLSWLTPSNNNDNGYLILCHTNHFLIANKTIASGFDNVSVNGLKPFTCYRCCVIPLLIKGNGTESCLSFSTLQSG